jgi:hypothetical protein
MSLEEDLKRVIGPSKEGIKMLEAWKKRPPTSLEKAKRQAQASREFREKYNKEDESGGKRGAR